MRSSLRLVVPAALLASAFAAGRAAGDDVPKTQFVLKLEKGAAVEFQQDQTQSSTTTVQGMPMQRSNEVHRAWTTKVVSVDESGGGSVEVKFGRVHGSATDGRMGTVEFDSDKAAAEADPTNPMAGMAASFGKAYTVLAGKTATAKVGKDGKVAEVAGLDGVADEAGAGNPMAKGMAQASSSAAAVKTFLQGSFAKLPEKPVSVGDTWTDEVKTDASGGMKLTTAFTFKVTAIDDDTATVTLDGKITMDAPPAPAAGADGKDAPKDGTGGAAGGAGGAEGGGKGGAVGGENGGKGARGGGGRGGRGGGGMGNMLRDGATLEKGEITGTFKVSRKDGMALVYDSQSTLVFKGKEGSQFAGGSMEQSMKSHVERKVVPAAPAAPAPATPPETK